MTSKLTCAFCTDKYVVTGFDNGVVHVRTLLHSFKIGGDADPQLATEVLQVCVVGDDLFVLYKYRLIQVSLLEKNLSYAVLQESALQLTCFAAISDPSCTARVFVGDADGHVFELAYVHMEGFWELENATKHSPSRIKSIVYVEQHRTIVIFDELGTFFNLLI